MLYFLSDRSEGWWNLHKYSTATGDVECVLPMPGKETGGPGWIFGSRSFDVCADGRVLCIVGGSELVEISPEGQVLATRTAAAAAVASAAAGDAGDAGTGDADADARAGAVTPLSLGTVVASRTEASTCYVMGGSPLHPQGVWRWDLTSSTEATDAKGEGKAAGSTEEGQTNGGGAEAVVLGAPLVSAMDPSTVDTRYFSHPEHIEFPTVTTGICEPLYFYV